MTATQKRAEEVLSSILPAEQEYFNSVAADVIRDLLTELDRLEIEDMKWCDTAHALSREITDSHERIAELEAELAELGRLK